MAQLTISAASFGQVVHDIIVGKSERMGWGHERAPFSYVSCFVQYGMLLLAVAWGEHRLIVVLFL